MEEKQLQMARHSMAHVLAKAIMDLYPNTKLTIGPAIDNGFYYDIDLNKMLTPDDFPAIEKKMKEILNKGEKFERKEVSKEEALSLFKENEYKTEIINELPDGSIISIYYLGDDFFDLCRGPHVENAYKLQNIGFKISSVNGAYWRGNEKNKMLQRIYCHAFASKKDLADYEHMLEEAKKRDHRKLGKELGLFFISEYAQGMPFYMPKGMTLKNLLIDYWRKIHKEAGYIEIETPMAMSRELWETSGHWDHYKENMYTFKVEGQDYAIKPMNCPGGMLYYMQNMHSYKEFPLRVGELGKVHRHEASGTLSGLLRVRCFTQDDAHIFMLPTQIEEEVKNVMKLVDETYTTFGLSYSVELSTMPENHIGDVAEWELAENALAGALKHIGLDYKINAGDGAFYGPKIDIHVKDCLGREWQCGTIQLDMQLPKRFNLKYTDENGDEKEPIMIHRVIYGSIERMMSILIENFAGAFPLWLAPEQVRVLSLTDRNNDYVNSIVSQLRENGFRAEGDIRNEKVGYKIREGMSQKIPYLIIVGDEEQTNNTISIRGRGNECVNGLKLSDFIERLKNEVKTYKK